MLEIETIRRLKINLEDYDYQNDIRNRLLMAHFSAFDLEVLEEIIYNPLTIPISKLLKRLNSDETALNETLTKFQNVDLLRIENNTIFVNKEMRKYYESQLAKFDDDFKCDMEFLQGLLKKVPIHILPSWYSISRTSNNIFSSILEKYFKTPQVYQRYLLELQDNEPIFSGIIQEVHNAPNHKVRATDLCEKFGLTKEKFEEYMLLLEFCFACFIGYTKEGEKWIEVVIPLYEWKKYQAFLDDTQTPTVKDDAPIKKLREDDFSFIKDSTKVLDAIKKSPIASSDDHLVEIAKILNISKENDWIKGYLKRLIAKLSLVRFIEEKKGYWTYHSNADEWMKMNLENKALHLYRHPLNHLISYHGDPALCTERNIREAEKCVTRVLHGKWVCFDDFAKGVTISIGKHAAVQLVCHGKNWQYKFPTYSSDDMDLIRSSILESLFEAGMVCIGKCGEKFAFRVTDFGRSLFEF